MQKELRTRDLVIVHSRYEGAHRDEAYCPEVTHDCSSIRFVLDGPMVVRTGGDTVDLRAGDLHASAAHGACTARTLTPMTNMLFIGWRGAGAGARLGGDAHVRPGRSTVASLHELAAAFGDDSPYRLEEASRTALAALRAEGFPLDVTSLSSQPSGGTPQIIATAVSRALAASQPTSLDLANELEVSEHHALRCANAHFDRFYFSVKCVFRAKRGGRSNLTRGLVPSRRGSERSDGRGQVLVSGSFSFTFERALRIEPPRRVTRCALWTRRSQIASAIVASPMA